MLDAVKSGAARVVGKEINLLRKVAANTAKLKVPVAAYPERLGKNIRYSYRLIHIKSILIQRQWHLRMYRRRSRLHPPV